MTHAHVRDMSGLFYGAFPGDTQLGGWWMSVVDEADRQLGVVILPGYICDLTGAAVAIQAFAPAGSEVAAFPYPSEELDRVRMGDRNRLLSQSDLERLGENTVRENGASWDGPTNVH